MSDDFYSSYSAYKNYQPTTLGYKDINRFDDEIWEPAAFTSDMRCLELGAGTGQFLKYLSHKGVQDFYGIDHDSDLKVVIQPEILERFECADVWEFLESSKNTEWDRVVLLDVLEHFMPEDGFLLLSLIAKSLKPSGKIIIKVPNGGSPWGMSYQMGDLTHKTAYNSESLRQVATACGLSVDTIYDQRRGSPRRMFSDAVVHKFLSWALLNPPPFWGANLYAILSLKQS